MKKQIHITLLVTYLIFVLFSGGITCKKEKKKLFFPHEQSKKEDTLNVSYEIFFLNYSLTELKSKDYEITLSENSLPANYEKTGNPASYLPKFDENGCFYFLDPFYYSNESGLKIKYCSSEFRLDFQSIKDFMDNLNKKRNYTLPSKHLELKHTSPERLEKKNYTVVYNAFIRNPVKEKIEKFHADFYVFSDKFIDKEEIHKFYLPRRFLEAEYAILIQEQEVSFLYKIKNSLLEVVIRNKEFSQELTNFFYKINYQKLWETTPGDIKIAEILYKNKSPVRITLQSGNRPVSLKNPKNQKYIYLLPHSQIIFDLQELEYALSTDEITLYFEPHLTLSYSISQPKINDHWMVIEDQQKPLDICFWENPCSIHDLIYDELKKDVSALSCNLDNFIVTEINPFGIYVNNSISPYGKFLEIQSLDKCDGNVFLLFGEELIPFPGEIHNTYYVFAPSEKYILHENLITHSSLKSLNVDSRLYLVQFFPFQKKEIFGGITENQEADSRYFLYGDKNSRIFKKVHSLIPDGNTWNFHPDFCYNLKECPDYAVSPGYPNPSVSSRKSCRISEIFIGGPYDSNNRRLSSDEFLEIECFESEENSMAYFGIEYNNKKNFFYFPQPRLDRFLVFGANPQCIQSEDKIVISSLTIPNTHSAIYTTKSQTIRITKENYDLAVNASHPRSLNILPYRDMVALTKPDITLSSCTGSATPNAQNRYEPVLLRDGYQQKSYTLLSSDNTNNINIYNDRNELLSSWTQEPFTTQQVNFHNFLFPFERKQIKIVINSGTTFYDEVFHQTPLCFIESLNISDPEYLRICFLETPQENIFSPQNLYLMDNSRESRIVPYRSRFPDGTIQNTHLGSLSDTHFAIEKHSCIFMIKPSPVIPDFSIPLPEHPFRDSYLVTSHTSMIGNNLSNNDYIEIYLKFSQNGIQQKVSLCSYGMPEYRLPPFTIPANKIVRNLYRKNNLYYGNTNFEVE